jgi:hypothetical protein
MPWGKRVMQFQRSRMATPEQCERHYLGVHSPWAVETFRGMDEVVGYHANLVVAQWDIRGGFRQSPDLWRYATMRYDREMEFGPGVAAMLAEDHQNFLCDLRRFDVSESLVVDLGGQALSTVKHLVVLDRPDDLGREEALDAVERVVAGLAEVFVEAYGARRMSVDRVLVERENLPMREEGQLPTGRRLEDTARLAYVDTTAIAA